MSTTLRLQIVSPSNTAVSAYIIPSRVYINNKMDKSGTLTAIIDTNYNLYYDETNAANPVKLNAYVALSRNGHVVFRGRIFNKRITRRGNTQQIKIECYDKLGAIAQCYPTLSTAAYTGDPVAHKGTTFHEPFNVIQATDVDLTQLHADSPYNGRWYPDITDANLWYPITTGTYQTVFTTAGAAITDAATTITSGSITSERFPNSGILKLENTGAGAEYVFYTGRSLNSGGTAWEFHNVKRGCLGTSGVAHDSGCDINLMVPKRISMDATYGADAYTYSGGSGNRLHAKAVREEGWWYFNDGVPTSVTMTYYYLDEINAGGGSGADFNTLASYLGALLEDSGAADGELGPGLASADYTVDIPLVVLPIASFDGSTNTLEFILRLIDERGSSGIIYDADYNEHPAIGVWYDSQDNEVYIKALVQSAANRITIPHITGVDYELSLDGVYSGISIVGESEIHRRDSRIAVLTDTYAAASRDKYLDATAYGKLIDSTWGIGKSAAFQAHGSGAGNLQSEALNTLRLSLDLASGRTYEIDALPSQLPQLANTYYTPDGYEGLCMGLQYRSEGGTEHLTLMLLDTNATRRVI